MKCLVFDIILALLGRTPLRIINYSESNTLLSPPQFETPRRADCRSNISTLLILNSLQFWTREIRKYLQFTALNSSQSLMILNSMQLRTFQMSKLSAVRTNQFFWIFWQFWHQCSLEPSEIRKSVHLIALHSSQPMRILNSIALWNLPMFETSCSLRHSLRNPKFFWTQRRLKPSEVWNSLHFTALHSCVSMTLLNSMHFGMVASLYHFSV